MDSQTPVVTPPTEEKVVKPFGSKKDKKMSMILIGGSLVVVLLGVGAGWLLSGSKMGSRSQNVAVPGTKVSSTEAGIQDESAFKDSVEGTLVEGGIDGEGNYHLERTGGPSQNVYLTSTVIDLAGFVGKKVKVWGETISGKKAGWLMDVGKIKVIE
jgi:hypothetical protein